MEIFFDIFSYPFMQRAFFAGFFISLLLGWLGAFLTTRKMSFFADGISHSSLAGVALALLLGLSPLPIAIVFAVLIAFGIYFIEKKTTLSADMAIGVFFTSAMAFGIVLLHFYEGYQPELMSFLFGNILTISQGDLLTIAFTSLFLLAALSFSYRKMLFLTFDPEGAYLSGIKEKNYDLFFYAASAVSIVLALKLVGIILVTALVIIPSAIAKDFSKSFFQFLLSSMAIAFVMVFFGLILSFFYDLPSGAVIILLGSAFFFLSLIVKGLKKI